VKQARPQNHYLPFNGPTNETNFTGDEIFNIYDLTVSMKPFPGFGADSIEAGA
jgi:hypothetical protein